MYVYVCLPMHVSGWLCLSMAVCVVSVCECLCARQCMYGYEEKRLSRLCEDVPESWVTIDLDLSTFSDETTHTVRAER